MADPVAYIHKEMKQRGITRKQLMVAIGGRSRVSEILCYRRKLTLSMIRGLYIHFRMDPRILILDYELKFYGNVSRIQKSDGGGGR